jgi:hypothetical protein
MKKRKLKMMLKPQLWISPHSWPGNIDFKTSDEWKAWFLSYERWLIHYTILAEYLQADLLCIGTELVQATLKHPELWRSLIKRIRQIYSGPIVYAANYGKEFEGISFWESLDYVGLDNYYPVRSNTHEGIVEMKQGFEKQREKIQEIAEKYNKPVLFTEIGYMANIGAGMGSREYDFPEYNQDLQAECYRLAMETYWHQTWFAGMYFWKWFSDPNDRGIKADPHSPHGRPAGEIMARWYGQKREWK